MATSSAELLYDCHCQLGESPIWDERIQKLYFVDINSKKLHVFDPATQEDTVIDAPLMITTNILTPDPDIVLATLHRTIVEVNVPNRTLGQTLSIVPEGHGVDDMRFNDGKAAPGGVLILGRMHLSMDPSNPGRLYSLDLRQRRKADLGVLIPEIGLPNGMAWDTSKKIMYFNETLGKTIYAFETDSDGLPAMGPDGKLKEVRKLKLEEGSPDGMEIDADGNLWVAIADQDFVACYAPDSGKLLRKVTLPVKGPTCCTFGGKNLDQLFITTMAEEGGKERGEGGLYVAKPGAKGLGGAYRAGLSFDGKQ